MKKLKELSPRIIRQIEILSKYYEIDMEQRTIVLELHYDHAEELFETDLSAFKHPRFKADILRRVSELLDMFPVEFKIHLRIQIDDYQDYQCDEITESFKDALELFRYALTRDKTFKLYEGVLLVIISAAILLFRQFLIDSALLEEHPLINEMMDITAWVFLWQAVTTLFLAPNEYRSISFKVMTRLESLTLYDKEHQILKEVSNDEIRKNWVSVSKLETHSKRLLLIAGAFAISSGIMTMTNDLTLLFKGQLGSNVGDTISSMVIATLVAFFAIFGGVGAISMYREKGPFQKFVPVLAWAYLISVTLILSGTILLIATQGLGGNLSVLVSSVVSSLAAILYFISYLILKRIKKRRLAQ